MHTRATGALGAALIALAIAAASAPASELGTAGGYTYVKDSANLADSTGPMTDAANAKAKCPNGSEPTGGGTSVTGDAANSYVSTSAPTKTGWASAGWHQNVPAAKVTSWGICTERKSQVHVVSDEVNVAGGSAGEASLSCGHNAVVSGGARPETRSEEFWLNKTSPLDSPDADNKNDLWRTTIWHQSGFFPPIDVSIDAVCGDFSNPLYEVKGVAFSTSTLFELTATCPAKKTVIGGGVDAAGASPSLFHVSATAPADSGDKGKVPDDGWAASVSNPTGAEMDVVVYATCV
jgi:hypothetical protein